jgi:hypothetical protein
LKIKRAFEIEVEITLFQAKNGVLLQGNNANDPTQRAEFFQPLKELEGISGNNAMQIVCGIR